MKQVAVPPNEAFAMLGVGITKGYELLNSGELKYFKIGRATRVTVDSIHAFVERSVAASAALGPSPARRVREGGTATR